MASILIIRDNYQAQAEVRVLLLPKLSNYTVSQKNCATLFLL